VSKTPARRAAWPSWSRLRARLSRLVRRRLRAPIWYAPAYRLPIPGLEAQSGQEPRRADLVTWYLVEERVARDRDLRTPTRASYEDLLRVHDAAYLESLLSQETLARIFAVSPGEIVVDEVMHTLRLAVGGTIAAARAARDAGTATFNLMGGFHHAGPALGGGMCALNDVAIAIAALRADGYEGAIVVLDLDAHPPDGLAACASSMSGVTIGSISGSDWGPLPGAVDEVFLPDADDAKYAEALSALLARLPRPALAFVIAGGDVLRGDRLGRLQLTLAGARARDLAVVEWLARAPSVWLPAGGYSNASWKVLAGSYLAVSRRSRRPVKNKDPLMSRYAAVARGLDPARLSGADDPASMADVEAELFGRPPPQPRFLDYYTKEGIEYALSRYGVEQHLRRLGYERLSIDIDAPDEVGQRVMVRGEAGGAMHLLIDLIMGRGMVDGEPALIVHWLSLRNPRAAFDRDRRALPGQEVPGLGLARDMGALFGRMAERLGLACVAFRPAFLHTAYASRAHFHFLDPARQLRFVMLLSDLKTVPLGELTRALAEGRVRLDGQPYAWEAELMIFRPNERPPSLELAPSAPRFTLAS
jgi:acetoin utilization deacetylase AcuC-like enzyme